MWVPPTATPSPVVHVQSGAALVQQVQVGPALQSGPWQLPEAQRAEQDQVPGVSNLYAPPHVTPSPDVHVPSGAAPVQQLQVGPALQSGPWQLPEGWRSEQGVPALVLTSIPLCSTSADIDQVSDDTSDDKIWCSTTAPLEETARLTPDWYGSPPPEPNQACQVPHDELAVLESRKLCETLADQPPGLERRPANPSQSTRHLALDGCTTTALQSVCPAPCGPCPSAQRMDSERIPGTSLSHDGAGQEDAVVVSPVDEMTLNPGESVSAISPSISLERTCGGRWAS